MTRKQAIKELIGENVKALIIEELHITYFSRELDKLPEGESKTGVLRKLAELEQMTEQRRQHQKILKEMLHDIELREVS